MTKKTYWLLRGSYAIAFVVGFVLLLIFNPRMLMELLAEVPVWAWIAVVSFFVFLGYVFLAERRTWENAVQKPTSKTQTKKNHRKRKA